MVQKINDSYYDIIISLNHLILKALISLLKILENVTDEIKKLCEEEIKKEKDWLDAKKAFDSHVNKHGPVLIAKRLKWQAKPYS